MPSTKELPSGRKAGGRSATEERHHEMMPVCDLGSNRTLSNNMK